MTPTSVLKPITYLIAWFLIAVCSSCNSDLPKAVPATDTLTKFPVTMQDQVPKKDISKEDLETFVLPGYTIMDHVVGDINNDSLPDAILVLRKPKEEESRPPGHVEKRPVLLILGQSDGSLKAEQRNDHLVLCYECGGIFGDPYDGLTIEGNGRFTFQHYGGSRWRWTRTDEFQYSSKDHDWLLVKKGNRIDDMLDTAFFEEQLNTVKEFGRVTFAKADNYRE